MSKNAQSLANIFLNVIVPVAKREAGENWLEELKSRYPMPHPPEKCGLGLTREQAEQIVNLGSAASDYFEGLVWFKEFYGRRRT